MQIITPYGALNPALQKLKPFTGGGTEPALIRINAVGRKVVIDGHIGTAGVSVELAGGVVASTTKGAANGIVVALADLAEAIRTIKPRVARADVEVGIALGPNGVEIGMAGKTRTIPTHDAKLPARPVVRKGDVPVVTSTVGVFAGAVWQAAVAAAENADAPQVLKMVHFHRDPGAVLIAIATDAVRVHQALIGDTGPTAVNASIAQTDVERAIKLIGVPGGSVGLAGEADELTMHLRGDKMVLWTAGGVTVAFGTWTETPYPYPQLAGYLEAEAARKRHAITLATQDAMGLFLLAEQAPADEVLVTVDPRKQAISATAEVVTVEDGKEKRERFEEKADIAKSKLPGIHEFKVQPGLLADALYGVLEDDVTMSFGNHQDPVLVYGRDWTAMVKPLEFEPTKPEPKAITAGPASPEPATEEQAKSEPKAIAAGPAAEEPAKPRARRSRAKAKPQPEAPADAETAEATA